VSDDLDTYREELKTWLADNLEPAKPGQSLLRGQIHYTVEGIAEERKIQRALFNGGYAGITLPTDYGGQELSAQHQVVFNEEAANYRMPQFGVAGGTTFGVILNTILVHATPEFLAREVPKILKGERLWVQFFSEPGAGSDLAGVTTRAEKDGDRWIINGSKIWSSGAYYADYGMCLARTNWDVPKHRGLTWFAVPCDAKGVTVEPIKEINGDIEFCQEFFDDVELTDDDMIGNLHDGWNVARTMLVHERGGSTGPSSMPMRRPTETARRLPPDLVKLAQANHSADQPAARQLIARAHVSEYVQRGLSMRIMGILRSGAKNSAGVAAYLKLNSGIAMAERARIGVELGGASNLLWEEGDLAGQATAINYLNGRVMAIAGGTNQVQRNGISEQVLGLPREPSYDANKPFREVVRDAKAWTGEVQ
jgi:alkylation response protein AidB-like acyl-CoA dehydrogenase